MWHEARRREKATQKLFNEHKKRAEKRREENKVDPSSLLQIHGVKSKIALDSNTYKLAAKSLVVWQGDKKTTIDRFDVRATLSSIPCEDKALTGPRTKLHHNSGQGKQHRSTILDIEESEHMKKLLNYERYRLLIQNDLNKVPEDKRLSLVSRSDSFSEPKMRKLERNYFGTSGEAGLSTDHLPMLNRNQGQQKEQHQITASRFQGASVGFNYNSAPPPLSYGTSGERVQGAYDEVDSALPSSRTNLANSIIELEDNDNLELDFVDKCQNGSKRSNEILSKYGLDCDEFNLLIETADDNTNCLSTKDLIRKLKQMKDKNEAPGQPDALEYYGPTLPPEMKCDVDDDDDDDDNEDEGDIPVQQRSPSGADIPTREVGHAEESGQRSPSPLSMNENDLSNKTKIELANNNLNLNEIPIPTSDLESTSRTLDVDLKIHLEGEQKSGRETLTKRERSSSPSQEVRRASTPLAYKRYRRSSRSLSRERLPSRRDRSSSSSSRSGSGSSSSSSSSSSSVSDSVASSSSSTSSSPSSSSTSATSSSSRSSSSSSISKSGANSRFRSEAWAHGQRNKRRDSRKRPSRESRRTSADTSRQQSNRDHTSRRRNR